MPKHIRIFALLAPFLIIGCSESEPAVQEPTAQDLFFTSLASHCGNAYAGKKVSQDAADADFGGGDLVMHVRECSDSEIRVPFHVQDAAGDWDRSRTWVLTRTADGLRLKHDHRHEDGEPDAVTIYGGDTDKEGTARKQHFPVDDESVELFNREGLTASVTNIWTVEVDPAGTEGGIFAYQLKRSEAGGAPEDRFFRVEFDLTDPISQPPAPWGFEE